MELNKEEIKALRGILLADTGDTDFIKINHLQNLFADYLKAPLFTTLDDVEIFEGQEVYYIAEYKDKIIKSKAYKSFTPHLPFSTESAAKEWLNNQPKYSLNEVTKAVNNWANLCIGNHNVKIFLDEN